eukprot:COSAG02_NODE_8195_length_2666_cov_1.263342_3_plen_90_part_00
MPPVNDLCAHAWSSKQGLLTENYVDASNTALQTVHPDINLTPHFNRQSGQRILTHISEFNIDGKLHFNKLTIYRHTVHLILYRHTLLVW